MTAAMTAATAGRRTLWHGLVDYAGVFPPAQHPLPVALERYADALTGEDGWVLGPCLVRASQLPELAALDVPDRLGLVHDAAIPADDLPVARLAQVETRVDGRALAPRVEPLFAVTDRVYVEHDDPEELDHLDEVARLRAAGHDLRAKIRTGGASATAFPSVEATARFVEACVAIDVPFKATAGLHHPVRHASEVPGAVEHGFVNVLAAVRAALVGDASAIRDALACDDPDEFDLATATWQGVGGDLPADRVREMFASFGSCSFEEPAGYLRALGVIPIPEA